MRDVPRPDPAPEDRERHAEQRTDRRDAIPRVAAAKDPEELAIDQAIEMTFPASDPPAWVPT